MQTVIYADILIVLNILISCLLLLTAARVLRLKPSAWRIVTASFLGGAYSLLIFAPEFGFILSIAVKLITSLSMVFIAFKPVRLRAMLKCSFIFFSMSIALAGFFLCVSAIIKPHGLTYKNATVYYDFSFISLIVVAVVFYAGFRVIMRFFPLPAAENVLFSCAVYVGEKCVLCKALLDTGNYLTDGYFSSPVMLMSYESAQTLFPERLSSFFSGDYDSVPADREWQSRIRVIPIKTVSSSALLPAFRADRIEIVSDKNCTVCRNSIVAVCAEPFDNKEFSVILNSSMFNDINSKGVKLSDEKSVV